MTDTTTPEDQGGALLRLASTEQFGATFASPALRWAAVLRMRAEGKKYTEIAQQFGIQRERARQLEALAIRRLNDYARKTGLELVDARNWRDQSLVVLGRIDAWLAYEVARGSKASALNGRGNAGPQAAPNVNEQTSEARLRGSR